MSSLAISTLEMLHPKSLYFGGKSSTNGKKKKKKKNYKD